MTIEQILRLSLNEDAGRGDITTSSLFPKPIKITARILAKENGVLCGIDIARRLFKLLDKRIRFIKKVNDGAKVRRGKVVCIIKGDARKILTGERTALNFLGRLSGISTLTSEYVKRIKPCKVKIMDTRKTTPGLRELEKYAVRIGEGVNHRMGLWDAALVKDNHLRVLSIKYRVLSMKNLVAGLRKKTKKKIEIEVEDLGQFKEALDAKPDIIMLDNMKVSDIKRAVKIRNSLHPAPLTLHPTPCTLYPTPCTLHPKLEVSGGVSLKNVRAIAKTGVDMISIGALTHSARSLDFSLEVG
jgi:nicotinate-nucleotide pyrophosphorylase (carboxylating)